MEDEPLRVLLVEDDAEEARLIRRYLKLSLDEQILDLDHARNLKDGLSFLRDSHYKVVITDLGLPDSDGLGTLRAVLESSSDAAVIVLTGNDSLPTSLAAVRRGAQDYLPKNDLDVGTLRRTIRHALERRRSQIDLEAANERLAYLAGHDDLTGLLNRRAFFTRAQTVVDAARERGSLGGILYLDLDSFKVVNDNHGHAAGDFVLTETAKKLTSLLRPLDIGAVLSKEKRRKPDSGIPRRKERLTFER
jgi:two-component system cell cycle response regulator